MQQGRPSGLTWNLQDGPVENALYFQILADSTRHTANHGSGHLLAVILTLGCGRAAALVFEC